MGDVLLKKILSAFYSFFVLDVDILGNKGRRLCDIDKYIFET